MYDVFISYVETGGLEYAKHTQDMLELGGITSLLALRDIPIGRKWLPTIDDAIDSASFFVVILTEGACESDFVRYEIWRARINELTSGRRIILPFKYATLADTRLPDPIRRLQYLAFQTKQELARKVIAIVEASSHEEPVKEVSEEIRSASISSVDEFIMADQAKLEYEMLNTVQRATTFIAATGGRAYKAAYLSAIESKVLEDKIAYARVIPSPPRYEPQFAIRHELCQHLCRLLAHPQGRRLTAVYRTDNLSIGYYLVTDTRFIHFMPSPHPAAELDTAISIPSKLHTLARYRVYIVEDLGGRGERITTQSRVKELCAECRSLL